MKEERKIKIKTKRNNVGGKYIDWPKFNPNEKKKKKKI